MKFTLRIEPLSQISKTMRQPPRPRRSACGCDCDGCNATGYGTHCLKAPCTLTRNRRSKAVVAAEPRTPAGRVRTPKPKKAPVKRAAAEPKPVEPVKVEPYRMEWFVLAQRGKTRVTLAAPEGQAEAQRMASLLRWYGWQATDMLRSTFNTDPRFHQITRETTNAGN